MCEDVKTSQRSQPNMNPFKIFTNLEEPESWLLGMLLAIIVVSFWLTAC